ncbi:NAD-dependent epimerase/dehydratase family protein [Nocardia sp. CC227C]|uniref:NAD-dependent epimerase/dehydratase family protein n=1 Tax=Nocardia sp. CC227C TaxID=3044562 RepID=UPI00278BE29F|nr:NAD-dependent epimerase/dehydratase family protein [Nocardia sp. CC227C]
MRVLVTGVSGTIGSAVARALTGRGHTVVGTVTGTDRPVPDDVEPLVADLFDPRALTVALSGVDAAVHTASSNDERSAELDNTVVTAVLAAFEGTGKGFVYTSGLWLHGNTGDTPVTEQSPFDPPMVVAWRPAVEELLERAAAERGVRTVRIRPGLVYGGGRGYVPMLLSPQDSAEGQVVRHFGDGSNRWSVIHADDLGELYALATESAPAGAVYLGTLDESVRVRDAARVVAEKSGAAVRDWDPEEARQYWSVMVDAFLLDQVATSAKAAKELGWTPTQPTLLAELAAN